MKNELIEWVLIPLSIIIDNNNHSNILLLNLKTKTLERFEPHGQSYPPEFNYNPKLLDQLLKRTFNVWMENLIYMSPYDYEPVIGFQIYDSYEKLNNNNIGDPEGFCLLWCIWYADNRIKYSTLSAKKLIEYLLAEIRMKHLFFRTLIRNYSKQITDYRDSGLSIFGYTINDYVNGKINQDD